MSASNKNTNRLRFTAGRVRVLQFLRDFDIASSAAKTAGDIGEEIAPHNIANRRAWGSSQVKFLLDHGFVEKLGVGTHNAVTYAITDAGLEWLAEYDTLTTGDEAARK